MGVLSDEEMRKKYDAGGFDALRGGGFQGFKFKSAQDVFKDFFGDKDPFADFDSFFDDVEVETNMPSKLKTSLEDFYKFIGRKISSEKIDYLVEKYQDGKEKRLVRKLAKKYGKKFPREMEKLRKDIEPPKFP